MGIEAGLLEAKKDHCRALSRTDKRRIVLGSPFHLSHGRCRGKSLAELDEPTVGLRGRIRGAEEVVTRNVCVLSARLRTRGVHGVCRCLPRVEVPCFGKAGEAGSYCRTQCLAPRMPILKSGAAEPVQGKAPLLGYRQTDHDHEDGVGDAEEEGDGHGFAAHVALR